MDVGCGCAILRIGFTYPTRSRSHRSRQPTHVGVQRSNPETARLGPGLSASARRPLNLPRGELAHHRLGRDGLAAAATPMSASVSSRMILSTGSAELLAAVRRACWSARQANSAFAGARSDVRRCGGAPSAPAVSALQAVAAGLWAGRVDGDSCGDLRNRAPGGRHEGRGGRRHWPGRASVRQMAVNCVNQMLRCSHVY